jgi:hypothetical protein
MGHPLGMELVKEVLALLIRAKQWEESTAFVAQLGCQEKQVQSALNVLFKGGYVVRKSVEGGKKQQWAYRLNQQLEAGLIEELANASLTSDDFLELSPIPPNERQSFRYQQLSESMSLKDAVDLAKQNGDIQVENLEQLAKSSTDALHNYLDELAVKDKRLAALMKMKMTCEHAFWEYAKKLPTA